MNELPHELPEASREIGFMEQENMRLPSGVSKQLLISRSVSTCFTGPDDHMFLMEVSWPPRPHTSGPDFRLQLLFVTPELLLKNDLRQLLLWPLPPHLKLHLPRLPYPGNLSPVLHYKNGTRATALPKCLDKKRPSRHFKMFLFNAALSEKFISAAASRASDKIPKAFKIRG